MKRASSLIVFALSTSLLAPAMAEAADLLDAAGYVAGRLMYGQSRDVYGYSGVGHDSAEARKQIQPYLDKMSGAELLEFITQTNMFNVDDRRTAGSYFDRLASATIEQVDTMNLGVIESVPTTADPTFRKLLQKIAKDQNYGNSYANRFGLNSFIDNQVIKAVESRAESIWANEASRERYFRLLVSAMNARLKFNIDHTHVEFLKKTMPHGEDAKLMTSEDHLKVFKVLAQNWTIRVWTLGAAKEYFLSLQSDDPTLRAYQRLLRGVWHDRTYSSRNLMDFPANAVEQIVAENIVELMATDPNFDIDRASDTATVLARGLVSRQNAKSDELLKTLVSLAAEAGKHQFSNALGRLAGAAFEAAPEHKLKSVLELFEGAEDKWMARDIYIEAVKSHINEYADKLVTTTDREQQKKIAEAGHALIKNSVAHMSEWMPEKTAMAHIFNYAPESQSGKRFVDLAAPHLITTSEGAKLVRETGGFTARMKEALGRPGRAIRLAFPTSANKCELHFK